MLLNGRREFLPSLTRSVALGSKASEHGFDSRRGPQLWAFTSAGGIFTLIGNAWFSLFGCSADSGIFLQVVIFSSFLARNQPEMIGPVSGPMTGLWWLHCTQSARNCRLCSCGCHQVALPENEEELNVPSAALKKAMLVGLWIGLQTYKMPADVEKKIYIYDYIYIYMYIYCAVLVYVRR